MLSIVLGSVLALAISFSQFLTLENISSIKKDQTEQSDQKAGDEKASFISLPSFSLPAPLNVQVNLNPHCLFEILFQENVNENYVEEDMSYADRLFETMFRVIISPNAP